MSCHPGGDEESASWVGGEIEKGEYLWPAWVSGATLLAAIVV